MQKPNYAGVIIDEVHPSIDKVYHYGIPAALLPDIQAGMRVEVPFGRKKRTEGYVISLEDSVPIPPQRIKAILRLADPYPVISEDLLQILPWMCKEYHCLTIEALRCFVPAGLRANLREKTLRRVYLTPETDPEAEAALLENRAPKMAAVLRVLSETDGIASAELCALSAASHGSLQSLVSKGFITIEEEETYRLPDTGAVSKALRPVLNADQRMAAESIGQALIQGGTLLIHGVTGSGKTEVYMQAVASVLARGRQAIVLVPEISLTPQTVGRFKGRFGEGLAVLHSALSLGERFDEWRRIKRGEVQIVVGARSAVFAPLQDIGIIIVDECHEDTYKSEVRPRYHTAEIARERCRIHGAPLVLGSATPSLGDYYAAQSGQFRLITLHSRAEEQCMPEVEIVDMRQELIKGNRSIFSQALYAALDHRLAAREQSILLLNRRGYARFVSCRGCGHVVSCSHCAVSLTYHADRRLLMCHYCGHQSAYPALCPACGSRYIKHFGTGTQKVEETIAELFPKARILRMDMDTTTQKGSHHRMLDAFGAGKYDILLGTQMVAKGLDFPRVTLVGVIAADAALNLPDYRSSEKTFQLITQVAGRAGRSHLPGQVILQTYQPSHYAIQYAARHDYTGFYEAERSIRERFQYPPYARIIRVLLTGAHEKNLMQYAQNMVQWIKEKIASDLILKQGLIEAGAYSAPLERIKNKYRWHVILRIHPWEETWAAYHRLTEVLSDRFFDPDISMALDMNPLSLL